jgi:hypothetical protein
MGEFYFSICLFTCPYQPPSILINNVKEASFQSYLGLLKYGNAKKLVKKIEDLHLEQLIAE